MSIVKDKKSSRANEIVYGDLGREPVRCCPSSVFSWNYDCVSPRHRAAMSINWFGEEGTIEIDGEELQVRKQGFVFPTWSLHHPTVGQVATAQGSGIFQRRYSITDSFAKSGQSPLDLVPSFFGQSHTIERAGRTVADIEADHLFTRKATITPAGGQISLATALFCFYLVAVNRRRQSN